MIAFWNDRPQVDDGLKKKQKKNNVNSYRIDRLCIDDVVRYRFSASNSIAEGFARFYWVLLDFTGFNEVER